MGLYTYKPSISNKMVKTILYNKITNNDILAI